MKLNHFKFQDGKIFWLPEYPEKEPPAYEFINPEDDLRRRYDQAVAKSLASAIEVAPEEIIIIKRLIVESVYKNGRVGDATKVITSMWQPENGKVYSVECEMGTCYQWKTPSGWVNVEKVVYDYWSKESSNNGRLVAHLKPVNKERESVEVEEVELREFIKNRFRQIEVILSGPGSAEWYPFDGFDREGVIAMKRAYQDIFRQLNQSKKIAYKK